MSLRHHAGAVGAGRQGDGARGREANGVAGLSGTLYVVATPIGNLEDITLRALRILGEVTLVAAEDTRRTGNLLRHYQIATPLISFHAHNEFQRTSQLVARLQAGESIAVVSDAGTPGISDPGATLVKAAREAGIRVDPIPGPSAVTAALSASGLALDKFAFAGFPPVRSKDRKHWFAWVASVPDAVIVCFEAPHRIEKTLTEMRLLLVNRPIILARELTKSHEEWLTDASPLVRKGEFVVIIGQKTDIATALAATPVVSDSEVVRIFGEITKTAQPSSRRDAIRAAAKRLGLPAKTVYEALERAKT